jgi:UDP-N-acetylmuramoyl-L-alanyl-D-glutamate--2,6-diaminopimelate ligase
VTTALITEISGILDWIGSVAPQAQLSADSRRIAAGDVFVAYPGDDIDGRAYIADAIERGARAILYEGMDAEWRDEWVVPHLAIDNLKMQAGQIAAAYYRQPDSAMLTIAVTGTNGKTSCTQWLGSALSRLQQTTAVIGTLGVGMFRNGVAGTFDVTGYTTPDAVLLQRTLADLRDEGAAAVAIEASSIGLHQGRMSGMHIDIALFTNFTRDHLDYHGDMQAYEAAKTMLFDWPGLRHAVINLDDAMGVRLVEHLRHAPAAPAITTYSLHGKTVEGAIALQASEIQSTQNGSVFQLASDFGQAQIRLQLIGNFNVSNVLGIAGVLLAKGLAWDEVIAAIERLVSVPGRMQQLGGHDAPLVVIDYAHTPDALDKALQVLRQIATERGGELWCIFGCGGERDSGKRPYMAKAAASADYVVVTNDNPRYEDPAAIIAQIVAGFDADDNEPFVIEDRAAAILWACQRAAKQDVILLAGKGHEEFQEIKGRKRPFLDADHAALALSTRVMKGVS